MFRFHCYNVRYMHSPDGWWDDCGLAVWSRRSHADCRQVLARLLQSCLKAIFKFSRF